MPQNRELLLHYARIGVDQAIQQEQATLAKLEAARVALAAAGNGSRARPDGAQQRIWTEARRAAVSRRMKAYWAGKRKA